MRKVIHLYRIDYRYNRYISTAIVLLPLIACGCGGDSTGTAKTTDSGAITQWNDPGVYRADVGVSQDDSTSVGGSGNASTDASLPVAANDSSYDAGVEEPETAIDIPDGSLASDSADDEEISGFYHMESLNRGLVAVQTAQGVYLSFRMFGYEYNPDDTDSISYILYRDGSSISTIKGSTNYLDSQGTINSKYSVRALINGVERAESETVGVWAENYLRIPLQVPPPGTTLGFLKCETPNELYTYSANDGSIGDVDGDGELEIFVKWDPSNAKDNSQSGCTGNVFIDAYKLDGTQLWRIDLGVNIRAGAHYTQFIVYDFDGDGKAEMAVKTAPGTKDGEGNYLRLGPAADSDPFSDYRSVANEGNRTGYILTGPEYLTVFNGETGAEMATENFEQARGIVSAWGDGYGNRVDRFLATAAYLDESGLPSIVMARGYYTRSTLTAWNYRNGQLSLIWKFDSDTTPFDNRGNPFSGQGAHSLSVANVDDDLEQEIIYGAMTIDHDGTGKCSTGFGHGDALHVSDFIPTREGLEAFIPHESTGQPAYDIHDPNSCEVLLRGPINFQEGPGRGVAADISPSEPGAEVWASGSLLLSATTGLAVNAAPGSTNFLIYWDADESRELEDGTSITKFNPLTPLVLQRCDSCGSNNGTKSTPTLVADFIGDWREEVIWRETDSSALRLYTTTDVTQRLIYTLLHDPQYRVAVSWQNVAYNQPPHPSFHIGNGMVDPPQPNIRIR